MEELARGQGQGRQSAVGIQVRAHRAAVARRQMSDAKEIELRGK